VEDYYYDGVEVPGSRLNIRFYGDEKNSEQIFRSFIIPFKGGEDVKYFVVRGVSEGR